MPRRHDLHAPHLSDAGGGNTEVHVVIVINGDPAASPGVAGGFVGFAVAFLALAGWLFRPLLDRT